MFDLESIDILMWAGPDIRNILNDNTVNIMFIGLVILRVKIMKYSEMF